MHQEFLMGNEAIALGALAAGVNLVAGYPGTPSTEVLGLSNSYAYELIRQGIIPSVRLGRRIVVPVERLKGILLELERDQDTDGKAD